MGLCFPRKSSLFSEASLYVLSFYVPLCLQLSKALLKNYVWHNMR